MATVDLVRGIFGSDSESDDERVVGDESLGDGDARTRGRDGAEDGRALAPALEIVVPREDAFDVDDASARARVVKLSNIFGVASRAFDAATHAEETESYADENGVERVRASDLNVIRWRVNAVTGEVETNARFVRWEDGTTHLVVGDEHLRANERDVAEADSFLYARRPGSMEARARLDKKLTFAPASLDSKTHKRLTRAVDERHGYRATRTRAHVSRVDPEREKEAVDAALLKAEREAQALLRKQQKMMRDDRESRYAQFGVADKSYTESFYERRQEGEEGEEDAGARMDADFLEADEAGDEGVEEEADSDAGEGGADAEDAPRERKRRALQLEDEDE